MRIEVKVPQLPESVAEATLVNWHKKAGDAVKRDENLIDIETDKVVLELPAPGDGVLVEIARPDGSTVTSNDVIAVIDTDAKDMAGTTPAAAAPSPAAPQPPAATARAAPAAVSGDGATALPAARKMMADQAVDPSSVTGTGRGGRITKGDVAGTLAARGSDTNARAGTAPARPAPAAPEAKAPPAVRLPATPGS